MTIVRGHVNSGLTFLYNKIAYVSNHFYHLSNGVNLADQPIEEKDEQLDQFLKFIPPIIENTSTTLTRASIEFNEQYRTSNNKTKYVHNTTTTKNTVFSPQIQVGNHEMLEKIKCDHEGNEMIDEDGQYITHSIYDHVPTITPTDGFSTSRVTNFGYDCIQVLKSPVHYHPGKAYDIFEQTEWIEKIVNENLPCSRFITYCDSSIINHESDLFDNRVDQQSSGSIKHKTHRLDEYNVATTYIRYNPNFAMIPNKLMNSLIFKSFLSYYDSVYETYTVNKRITISSELLFANYGMAACNPSFGINELSIYATNTIKNSSSCNTNRYDIANLNYVFTNTAEFIVHLTSLYRHNYEGDSVLDFQL
jgi:hypothetical protein